MIERLRRLTKLDAEQLLAEEQEWRERAREFDKGIGLLAEVAHERLDRAASTWKAQLRSLVKHGVPENLNHPNTMTVATLLSLLGNMETLHRVTDELTEEGAFDTRSRADIEAKQAEFRREIAARRLGRERLEQQARLDSEKEVLAEIDRRAEDALRA